MTVSLILVAAKTSMSHEQWHFGQFSNKWRKRKQQQRHKDCSRELTHEFIFTIHSGLVQGWSRYVEGCWGFPYLKTKKCYVLTSICYVCFIFSCLLLLSSVFVLIWWLVLLNFYFEIAFRKCWHTNFQKQLNMFRCPYLQNSMFFYEPPPYFLYF